MSEAKSKSKSKPKSKPKSKSKPKPKAVDKPKSKSKSLTKETPHPKEEENQSTSSNQENTTQTLNVESEIIDNESDYRSLLLHYDISKNKSRPILTSYEKSLIIGKRATQLSLQSQEYIDVKLGMTPIDIAEEELKQKKIPYMLKRIYGNQIDYWKLDDLFIN